MIWWANNILFLAVEKKNTRFFAKYKDYLHFNWIFRRNKSTQMVKIPNKIPSTQPHSKTSFKSNVDDSNKMYFEMLEKPLNQKKKRTQKEYRTNNKRSPKNKRRWKRRFVRFYLDARKTTTVIYFINVYYVYFEMKREREREREKTASWTFACDELC